jgi:soluble lytic murein transglycosylase-like protein
MTSTAFYTLDKTPQIKSALAKIAKKYMNVILQAEQLTKVPGAIILAVIFAESAGDKT